MSRLSATLALVILAGCGGGGGGTTSNLSSTPATTQITGVAVDGYLSSADVFYDLNDNGVMDSGEPSATTGANGSYALTINTPDIGAHKVVLKATAGQTVDSDSPGAPITAGYVLFATSDHPEIVSPLTTQIVAAMSATPALTSAQAEAQVKATLGLSSSTASLFQDFANKTSQASNTDLVMLANHAKVIRAEMQTQVAATPTAAPLDVIKTVATTIQAQIKSGALDLTKINVTTALDSTSVTNIVTVAVGGSSSSSTTATGAGGTSTTGSGSTSTTTPVNTAAAKTLGTATSIFGSPNSVYQ